MGANFSVAAEAKTLSNTIKDNWPYESFGFSTINFNKVGPTVADGSSAGGRRHIILLATIESFDISPSQTETRAQERKR